MLSEWGQLLTGAGTILGVLVLIWQGSRIHRAVNSNMTAAQNEIKANNARIAELVSHIRDLKDRLDREA